jgi:hypothetical protein
MKKKSPEVFCQYCTKKAEFVDSSEVYSRSYGMIYLCRSCGAYVGVHRGTNIPLGTLANAELRKLRNIAHSKFDPHWMSGNLKRKEAYAQMAEKLNVLPEVCHIAMFDEARCKEVIKLYSVPF